MKHENLIAVDKENKLWKQENDKFILLGEYLNLFPDLRQVFYVSGGKIEQTEFSSFVVLNTVGFN